MSNEELVVLIQQGHQELMEQLWEQTERLITMKANHVITALQQCGLPRGVTLEDLEQTGYLALADAVEHFDSTRGAKFSTVLCWYLQTYFAYATGFRTQKGRGDPLNAAFSLEKKFDDGDGQGAAFAEVVPDPAATSAMQSVEEQIWYEQLKDTMNTVLSEVPEKYREVLNYRYYRDLTLSDVGAIIGKSKEDVRRLEIKGLNILRKPENASRLYAFHNFNAYSGTSLGAFQNTGMSVQERYLVDMEREQKQRKKRMKRDAVGRALIQHEEMMAQVDRDVEYQMLQMTPEEKQRLLETYGFS